MSLNGLTGSAGLKLAPLVVETLVKHYFERLRVTQKIPATTSPDEAANDGKQGGSVFNNNLRQEELLYDQAFTIVKVSIARPLPKLGRCIRAPCTSRPFVFGCTLWRPVADPHDLISHHHV
jgi:hypothetical protein